MGPLRWLFLFANFLFSLACHPKNPVPLQSENGDTRVKIEWVYKNFPAEITIHELKRGKEAVLWQTGSALDTKDTPIGDEIDQGVFAVQQGKEKYFVLAAKNKTAKPIYFFAAPHHLLPAEAGLGFQFKCLCVNHLFAIKPNETWYRIVRLRLTRENHIASITISHDIVGIDKKGREEYLIDAAEPKG
ncbi:MAG: hypothetical protein LDLANPLL_00972 [Turneriella sp.]|nr:hypothetical protein [Turneriella sp.]